MNIDFRDAKAVEGGIKLRDGYFVLNSEECDNIYKVSLGTGTAWVYVFIVDAYDEQSAISRVVQFCIDNGYIGLYHTFELMEYNAENDEEEPMDVFDYADYIGWHYDGDTSCFIDLQGLENLGD